MVSIKFVKEKSKTLLGSSPYLIVDSSFDLHRYSQSLAYFKLSKIEKRILYWLMNCTKLELYSLSVYCEENDIKLMSARAALNHLVSYGLLKILKIPIVDGGQRYKNCYVLRDVDVEKVAANQLQKKVSPTVLKVSTAILKIEPNYALVDNLICGVLAPCLPLSKKKNAKFESTIRWFGKPLVMITSSIHDEYVAEIDDLKTYIAMLSCVEILIKHCINDDVGISDTFRLSLSQVANARGHASKMSDNSRIALRQSIDRLRHTKFEITTSDYSFDKIVGAFNDSATLVEINPISNAMFFVAERGSLATHMVEFQLPKVVRDALVQRVQKNIQGEFEALPLFTYNQDPLLFILKKHLERFYTGGTLVLTWLQLKNLLSQPSSLVNFRSRIYKLADKLSADKTLQDSSTKISELKFRYENVHAHYKDEKWHFKLDKPKDTQDRQSTGLLSQLISTTTKTI